MNNHIKILLIVLFFIPLNASINISNDYRRIASMDRYQAENLYRNTEGVKNKFEIALFTGHPDYLASLPNKKNWVTNALFNNKNTVYVNSLINQTIEFTSPDSLTNQPILKFTTPLHFAIQIAAYHRINSYDARKDKNEVLFKEYDNKHKDMIKTIRFLIDNGADVNAVNSDGKTPLHIACEKGEYKGAVVLLDAHADPRIQDPSGRLAQDMIHKKTPMLEKHLEKLKNKLQLTTEAIDANNQKAIKIMATEKSLNKQIATIAAEQHTKKNSSLAQTTQQNNIAEIAPSTSSDTTTSMQSSKRTALTNNNNRHLSLKPEASNKSIEDSFLIEKRQTKPTQSRPTSAVTNRQITLFNAATSQSNLIINTNNNIEFNQEIIKTNLVISPTLGNRSKPTNQLYGRNERSVIRPKTASQRSAKVHVGK